MSGEKLTIDANGLVTHIENNTLSGDLSDYEAIEQDDKVFELPDNFYDQIEQMGFEKIDDSQLSIPKNVILH